MKFRDVLSVCKGEIQLISDEVALVAIGNHAIERVNTDEIVSIFSEKTLDSEVKRIDVASPTVFRIHLKEETTKPTEPDDTAQEGGKDAGPDSEGTGD